jgi:hypothetical protein
MAKDKKLNIYVEISQEGEVINILTLWGEELSTVVS